MKRIKPGTVKPFFWRSLKDDTDLDGAQFTLGRYYAILGMIKGSDRVWVLDNRGDCVSICGMRLGLKLRNPPVLADKGWISKIVEAVEWFL